MPIGLRGCTRDISVEFRCRALLRAHRAFVTFSRKLMLAMDRSISEIEDQDCDIFELARLTLRVGNHALSVVEHGPGGLRSGGLNAGFSLAGHAVGRVEANGASGRTWAARGHEWTLSAGGT